MQNLRCLFQKYFWGKEALHWTVKSKGCATKWDSCSSAGTSIQMRCEHLWTEEPGVQPNLQQHWQIGNSSGLTINLFFLIIFLVGIIRSLICLEGRSSEYIFLLNPFKQLPRLGIVKWRALLEAKGFPYVLPPKLQRNKDTFRCQVTCMKGILYCRKN